MQTGRKVLSWLVALFCMMTGVAAASAPARAVYTGPTWEMLVYGLGALALWLLRREIVRHDREFSELRKQHYALANKISEQHVNRDGINEIVKSAVDAAVSNAFKDHVTPMMVRFAELSTELKLMREKDV